MEHTSSISLEASLFRSDFEESNQIEIKIPVNIPYQTEWTSFGKYGGEIDVNGVQYKYIKRKIEDGNLILRCMANNAKQILDSVKNDLVKTNNARNQHDGTRSGIPVNGQAKNPVCSYISVLRKYNAELGVCSISNSYTLYRLKALTSLHVTKPAQPPEA